MRAIANHLSLGPSVWNKINESGMPVAHVRPGYGRPVRATDDQLSRRHISHTMGIGVNGLCVRLPAPPAGVARAPGRCTLR